MPNVPASTFGAIDNLAFQIVMESANATKNLGAFVAALKIANMEASGLNVLLHSIATGGGMSLEMARQKVLGLDEGKSVV